MPDHTTGAGDEGADDRADAASREQVDRLESDLRSDGRPFARVTVVRREAPVSATVGDRAVVTEDGDLYGWVGGASCAQSVAVDEALAALDRGEPTLVGLAPDPDDVARPGLTAYPMTCHSGGTIELFVEPVLPTPRLVVVGDSAIARTLARLAATVEYDVTVVTGPDTDPDVDGADEVLSVDDAEAVSAAIDGAAAVVVASVGAYDEAGLAVALDADVQYVGLVASPVRGRELLDDVATELGLDPDAVADAVTTPAGLDVGAETPEEIAVSILAELVAVRRDGGETAAVEGGADARHDRDETSDDDAETAVDPVCGMDVTVGDAPTMTLDGETFHFCGEGCAEAFRDDPERYRDEEVPARG
ncbi:XdhC family protein [Haloarchaeobius sp. HRN-SO-5]|uniref:XdhC family protein n=1 Tax=Haloarchaeobius sp. HRN-SO-5 TaxID=3446118 RepID=UPI003EBB5421